MEIPGKHVEGLGLALMKVAGRHRQRMDVVASKLTEVDAAALFEHVINEQGEIATLETELQARKERREELEDLAIAATLVLSGRWPSRWLNK